MHGAECEQSFGIRGTIFGDPVVYFGGETDYMRADVVDQAGAFDFGGVHKFQECGGAGGVSFYFVVVAAAAFDQLQRGRIDHFVRVDVDVNVDDWRQIWMLLKSARLRCVGSTETFSAPQNLYFSGYSRAGFAMFMSWLKPRPTKIPELSHSL